MQGQPLYAQVAVKVMETIESKPRLFPSPLGKHGGKVYCFVPLPFRETGLPVYINGKFIIQSSRRSLWSGRSGFCEEPMLDSCFTECLQLWHSSFDSMCLYFGILGDSVGRI